MARAGLAHIEGMKDGNEFTTRLRNKLRKTWGRVGQQWSDAVTSLRNDSERVRYQVKHLFDSTSDQVLVKAEETRKAVRLRMAVLEVEHHLNRLYPQIGKLVCDLSSEGRTDLLDDPDLNSKIQLADEYRRRLQELREQETEYHERVNAAEEE